MALFRGEIVTKRTDWFSIADGRLQLGPYSHPCLDVAVAASISPSGPKIAGRLLAVWAVLRRVRDLVVRSRQLSVPISMNNNTI
jgi:limonene 1,2-monooxygenase